MESMTVLMNVIIGLLLLTAAYAVGVGMYTLLKENGMIGKKENKREKVEDPYGLIDHMAEKVYNVAVRYQIEGMDFLKRFVRENRSDLFQKDVLVFGAYLMTLNIPSKDILFLIELSIKEFEKEEWDVTKVGIMKLCMEFLKVLLQGGSPEVILFIGNLAKGNMSLDEDMLFKRYLLSDLYSKEDACPSVQSE